MTIKENGVPSENELTYEQLNLRIDGVSLKVATVRRGGDLAPLVFLHGFGSTKEDYADIALQHALAGARSSPTTHRAAGRPPARTCAACAVGTTRSRPTHPAGGTS